MRFEAVQPMSLEQRWMPAGISEQEQRLKSLRGDVPAAQS